MLPGGVAHSSYWTTTNFVSDSEAPSSILSIADMEGFDQW